MLHEGMRIRGAGATHPIALPAPPAPHPPHSVRTGPSAVSG